MICRPMIRRRHVHTKIDSKISAALLLFPKCGHRGVKIFA